MAEKDIIEIDVTQHLYQTLWLKPLHNELLNISVQGEVASGKSLVAEQLFLMTNYNLAKQKKLPKNFDYFKHIVADQTEFLRLVNSEEKNICLIIDEWNRMSLTGINATTEEKWYDYFSDVFAQMYWHRISTSPSHITDKNATIWLDIISADKENKRTRCRVRYHSISDHQALTIGHANIDVSQALAQPWHERYRKRKFERMNLLQVHGVRDIRDLEFAEIVIAVVEDEDLSKIHTRSKANPEVIMSAVREEVRKRRLVYSLIAYSDIAKRAQGIFTLEVEARKEQEKAANSKSEAKMKEHLEASKQIMKIRQKNIDSEKQLCEIYKKYKSI